MADGRGLEDFCGTLREILDRELELGNRIREVYHGDWPHPGVLSVLLENPFSPPIHKDLPGIRFRNVNDPHYWKAEYHDPANNQLLLCGFGATRDFTDL